MPTYLSPFTKKVDLQTGVIPEAVTVLRRHLRDLQGLFVDSYAEAALLTANPLLYEVHEATEIPDDEGQLRYSTTIISPGKVGNEYFFTKGHYHAKGNRAELYFALAGEGYLLLQNPEGEVNAQQLVPGAMAYIPPFWAHRTVNVGRENFAFLATYSADAGNDYATVAARGFAKRMIEIDGKPTLVPSSRWT